MLAGRNLNVLFDSREPDATRFLAFRGGEVRMFPEPRVDGVWQQLPSLTFAYDALDGTPVVLAGEQSYVVRNVEAAIDYAFARTKAPKLKLTQKTGP